MSNRRLTRSICLCAVLLGASISVAGVAAPAAAPHAQERPVVPVVWSELLGPPVGLRDDG